MIVTEQNSNFNELLKRLGELKDKPIFQAYHTFGTMFLLDMGEKTEYLSKGKIYVNGENTIIIENYTWEIREKNRTVITSKDGINGLRKNIPVLVDKEIIGFNFDNLTFTFVFTDNLSLKVTLSEEKKRDIGIRLANSNWIDIGPGQSWVETTADHVE